MHPMRNVVAGDLVKSSTTGEIATVGGNVAAEGMWRKELPPRPDTIPSNLEPWGDWAPYDPATDASKAIPEAAQTDPDPFPATRSARPGPVKS